MVSLDLKMTAIDTVDTAFRWNGKAIARIKRCVYLKEMLLDVMKGGGMYVVVDRRLVFGTHS